MTGRYLRRVVGAAVVDDEQLGIVRAGLADEGRKRDVEVALAAEEGAEVIDWSFAHAGLVVKES